MHYDGPLEPNTIIISIPLSVKEKFREQYMTLGMTSSQATDNSIHLIRYTVEKYVPAGSPFVIIDEDDKDWDIPIGQFISTEEWKGGMDVQFLRVGDYSYMPDSITYSSPVPIAEIKQS